MYPCVGNSEDLASHRIFATQLGGMLKELLTQYAPGKMRHADSYTGFWLRTGPVITEPECPS